MSLSLPIGYYSVKPITIKASFDIDARTFAIPKDTTISEMARYAKVRNPKRWLRNRRLNRKFCKHPSWYLPDWAMEFLRTSYVERTLLDSMVGQIEASEDERVLKEMRSMI